MHNKTKLAGIKPLTVQGLSLMIYPWLSVKQKMHPVAPKEAAGKKLLPPQNENRTPGPSFFGWLLSF